MTIIWFLLGFIVGSYIGGKTKKDSSTVLIINLIIAIIFAIFICLYEDSRKESLEHIRNILP